MSNYSGRPLSTTDRLAALDRELAGLAGYCRQMQLWLARRLRSARDRPEALRHLGLGSHILTHLASLHARRAAADSAGEVERFFEEVSRIVWEEAGELDACGPGPGSLPPPA